MIWSLVILLLLAFTSCETLTSKWRKSFDLNDQFNPTSWYYYWNSLDNNYEFKKRQPFRSWAGKRSNEMGNDIPLSWNPKVNWQSKSANDIFREPRGDRPFRPWSGR